MTGVQTCALPISVQLRELPAGTDTKVLSRFFATTTHGLMVVGKSDIHRKHLKDVVEVIISALR